MLSAKSIVGWQRSCTDPVEALRHSDFVAYRSDFENHREAVRNARSQTSKDLELSSSAMRSLNATLRRTKEYKRAVTADAVRKENTRLVQRLLEIQRRSDLRQSILREGGFSAVVPASDECTRSSRPGTQGHDGGAPPPNSGTLNLPWRRRVMDGINKDNASLYERLRQAGPRVQAVPALRKAYKAHQEQVARIRRFRPRAAEAWSISSSSGFFKGSRQQQPGRKQGGQQQEQQNSTGGSGEGSGGTLAAEEPVAPAGEENTPGEGAPPQPNQEGANESSPDEPLVAVILPPHMICEGSDGSAAGGGMLRPDTAPAGSSRPGTGQRHPPAGGAANAALPSEPSTDGSTVGGVSRTSTVAAAAGPRPMTTFSTDVEHAGASAGPRPMTTFSADDHASRQARTPGNLRGDAQEPLFPPGPPVGEAEAEGYSDDDFDDDFDPESDDQSDERDLGAPCRSEREWEAEEAALEAAQSDYSEEGDSSTPEQGAPGQVGQVDSPAEPEESENYPADDFEDEADIRAEEDDDKDADETIRIERTLSNSRRTPPGEALEESSPEPSD